MVKPGTYTMVVSMDTRSKIGILSAKRQVAIEAAQKSKVKSRK